MLGLLLGNRNHWYTDWYLSREPERVAQVYPETGGLICAFSPRNISLINRCAYGLWYDGRQGHWHFGALPLPSVVWRRSFKCDADAVRRLQRATGARVFNSRRFDKWELYTILSKDAAFRRHLPETAQVSEAGDVLGMLDHHPDVVLKPADLSRGRGILFVKRTERDYLLTDCRSEAEVSLPLGRAALADFVDAEIVGRRYLCQQRINLARIDGAPFDVRVVMQKSPQEEWQCSGIECRLAGAGHSLTNIAAGGHATTLAEATARAFGPAPKPDQVYRRVVRLSERLCCLLDATGETFAEFGVDVGLDVTGKAWLIEANVIPTFKGFRAIDMKLYRRLLSAPLFYANHLAGFGEDDDGTNL